MNNSCQVVVTGSAGLVGSGLSRRLLERPETHILGIDNNSRQDFFGLAGSTAEHASALAVEYPDGYLHSSVDITDREKLHAVLNSVPSRPSAIIHCAAQPSHDWAGIYPVRDFEINANGTLHLLDWLRRNAPQATFIFLSSNKVYSFQDVETIQLIEHETRYDVTRSSAYWDGIDNNFPLGRGSRSLYGTSKLSADLLTQEFAAYYGMRAAVLRCGSMTGPHHSAVEMHGFLAYVARQVCGSHPYHVNGYQGKQVRDNLYFRDVVAAIELILDDPPDELSIFNLGGGRENACSVVEALDLAAEMSGQVARIHYREKPRISDFRWWVTDNSRYIAAYPTWRPATGLREMLGQCVNRYLQR